jgi:hypothetical protein
MDMKRHMLFFKFYIHVSGREKGMRGSYKIDIVIRKGKR